MGKDHEIASLKQGYADTKDREFQFLHGAQKQVDIDAEQVSHAAVAAVAPLEETDSNDAKYQRILSQKDTEIAELKKQLAKDDEVFSDIRRRGQHLRGQYHLAQEKAGEYEAALSQASERARLLDMLAAKHQEHIALLAKKNQLAAGNRQGLKRNMQVYKEKLDDTHFALTAQKDDFETQIAQLQAALKDMQSKSAGLKDQVMQRQKDKDGLYDLLDKFQLRLKETSDVNMDQDKTLSMYKAQIQDLKEQLEKAQGALRAKEMNVAARDISLDKMQSNISEKSKESDALMARMREQLKTSDEQLAQLKEKLTVAEAKLMERNERQENLARLQDMLKSSREEVIQLNTLLRDKEKLIAKLKADLNTNSTEFESQTKALQAIQAEVDQQQERSRKLAEDMQWKDKEIARLKKQIKEQKIDLLSGVGEAQASQPRATDVQMSTLAAQLKETQDALKEANRNNDTGRLKEALNDARQQIATLKEKLRLKQDMMAKDSPAYIKMAQEAQSLKESLDQAASDRSDLQDKNADIEAQLLQTKAALQECIVQLGQEGPINPKLP